MNFTEKYIKMCEKAEEIQKLWKPKTGDWAFDVWHRNPVVIIEELDSKNLLVSQIGGGQYENERDKFIWLPTQEQLQEMVYEGGHPGYLLDKFVWWVIDYEKYRYSGEISYPSLEDFVCRDFSSMNELWLAFVMWTKYHKVWDDEKEEWRKI